MQSMGLALKLRPGSYDEYKRRHDDLWPELRDVMDGLGVSMVIYRMDDYLFIYATAPSEQAWTELDNHPVTPRWNKYMSEVLETDGNGEIVSTALAQAFAFGALS